MTPRERVRKTLNFEEPDRVPIDWGQITLSGITVTAYKKLLAYLGLDEEIIVSDPIQRLALPSEEVLQRFGADTRVIWPNAPENWTYSEAEDGSWTDEWGVKWDRCGEYCDSRGNPLAGATTIEDLKAYKMPDPADPSRYKGLREKAKKLYEETDYALVAGAVAALYFMAWNLRGYQNFMVDVACDSRFANYLLDMLVDWHLESMDHYLGEIGDYVEIMWAGDDWGSQAGPIIHPEEFAKNVAPRFEKIISFMKTKSSAKLAYHSCGSVYWAMQQLSDIGVDILHPLQPNAAEMGDSVKLKSEYHGKLVFHGGLDNQGVFHLSKDQVIADVEAKMAAFKPGAGYLFSTGHNIQGNCPPENIVAIFETAQQHWHYS